MNPFDLIFNNDYPGLVSYLEDGNVNIVDEKGMSLLDYAIIFHNNDMFTLLLKSFINLNLKDRLGNTCYHYAVINNRLGNLKALLNENGNFRSKNSLGQSPLYLACLYGRTDMVLLFMEYLDFDFGETNSNEESIFIALIKSKNIDLIERLGGYNNYIEKCNYFGQSPLTIAVKQNSLDMVKFLIDKNAFVNTKDNSNSTPLFYAYQNENKEIVSLLLEHGAILDCKDRLTETIFDKKVSEEFKKYVEEKISNLNCRNYEKVYPLHYAIYINDEKKIHNALNLKNINRKDPYGYTPYDIAKFYKNRDLCILIQTRIKDYSKLLFK